MRLYSGVTKPKPGARLDLAHPLARDLIARYLFNEGAGTLLYDVSPKGNHATLTSMDPATDWVGSARGGGLDFDGADDHATNSTTFSINGSPGGTISVWFRLAAVPSAMYLVSCGTGDSISIQVASATSIATYVNGSVSAGNPAAAVPSMTDYRWHHFVVTYDGATIRLYLDSVLAGTSTAATGNITVTGSNLLTVGRHGSGVQYAAAQIDDVRVYRRALSSSEVARLYSDPYADMRGPRLWWRNDRVHAPVEIELELAGPGNGWTNVTPDLLIKPTLKLGYGMPGGGPLDLVAAAGKVSFALNNSEYNSAAKLGYYSPQHVNCRPGFAKGIGVRCLFDGSYVKWQGRLTAIEPMPGKYKERRTICTGADWFNEAASTKVNVATQVNKLSNEGLASVIAAIPRQPTGVTYDTGDSLFPYSLDSGASEGESALTLIQRICQSEGLGRFYSRGGIGGVTHRFEKRTGRLTPVPVASFHGVMQGLDSSDDTDKVKNRAKVTAHPKTVDAGSTNVLFSKPSQSNQSVAPGQTITIVGRYTDPAQLAARIGGVDMQAPTATTDYLMNASADGSGADLTANFTVIAAYGGNQVIYTITNNGGTLGYVTKLQARGRGLKDYTPIDAEEKNQASIDLIGESVVTLDMSYQPDGGVAKAIAEFIVTTLTAPGPSECGLEFTPRDDAEFAIAIAIEVGDPISISEEVTAINGVYYVQSVSVDVNDVDRLNTTFRWVLQRALVADYWQLGVAGFSELGITTVLAPL